MTKVATSERTGDASLEEQLTFERLLSDLSVRFANVAADSIVPEIESALKQLLKFLGFDRSAFWEFVDNDKPYFLCSAAVEGVEPPLRGPIPPELSWFARELGAGRTVIIRSDEDLPPDAAEAAEFNRRAGIRSVLVIPLPVGGRVVAAIGFGALSTTREWPVEFIARVTVIGEVMAQALARTRSETALRLSETRWRSIFETSTLAITVFDQNLRYTATNPAFQAMLGYTDQELRQLTPLDITAEERGNADSRLAALREGTIDHYVVEKQYRRKDGTVIWGQASVARASQSEPEMFIGTMIDITESKRAQDNLFATQSELARVAQLTTIGQMAASIAHEIKQPLTSIMMGSSAGQRWLAKKPPNLKEVRACFDLIADNGDRANQVIEGIRAMFQKGRQEKEFVDINQLIRETLELVRSKAQKTRIVLRSDLADNLPPMFGRRIQLQQVMFNLFTNAIEAMDAAADDNRLLVVSSAFRAPRDVLVAVADSGPGLAAENVNRIFDPFFTTKSQGMGMGLSICRSIVEAHDGRLAARSGAERGAVFEMTLPAADMSRLSPPGRAAT
ncbi:MAG: PAS domain S-box protein [Xanthobacteraceae bacterium]